MSVRHTPAPPILTITSKGPSTFGSSMSSTDGRTLYWWSRTACIHASPHLRRRAALTLRSFDTSLNRTSGQSFTMVGNQDALALALSWALYDSTGAAAAGRDRR